MQSLFNTINSNMHLWLEPQGEKLILMLGINPEYAPPKKIKFAIGDDWVLFEYVDTVKNQAIYRATRFLLDCDLKRNPDLLELGVQEMLRLID